MTSHDTSAPKSASMSPVVRYAALFLVAGLVLIPLVATVLGGFKTLGDLRVNPFGIPGQWEWRNYWDILGGSRYWHLMGNSAVIALLTVSYRHWMEHRGSEGLVADLLQTSEPVLVTGPAGSSGAVPLDEPDLSHTTTPEEMARARPDLTTGELKFPVED